MSISSRVLRKFGLAVLAAALALSTTVATAATQDPQSSSASQAVQIPTSGPLSGSLGPAAPGKPGTTFAYYRFRYDGGNRVVSINMQVYPDDVTILSELGFVLYGPRTNRDPSFIYVAGGAQPKKVPNISANLISLDPGDYLIQVYNDSTVPISFAIWADNLPLQPLPSPNQGTTAAKPSPVVATVASPVATPVPAVTPTPSASSASGTAAATPTPTGTPGGTVKSGGTFSDALAPTKSDIFQFDYPGDLSVYTINLQVYPDDPVILKNAGFQVFTPNGSLQVKGGAQTKLVPNVSANVISKVPGTYTVKIYNDQPNTAVINYVVTLVANPPAKA